MTASATPRQRGESRGQREIRQDAAAIIATVASFERSGKFRVDVLVKRRPGVEPYISTCGFFLTKQGTWIPNGRPVNWRGAEIPQLLLALRDALKVVEAAS